MSTNGLPAAAVSVCVASTSSRVPSESASAEPGWKPGTSTMVSSRCSRKNMASRANCSDCSTGANGGKQITAGVSSPPARRTTPVRASPGLVNRVRAPDAPVSSASTSVIRPRRATVR